MSTEPFRDPARRRPRADGERSRQAILLAATRLATVEGLDGLSIGRLAEHVGMSKSGLYAHFRSKEDLQLAAIDTAKEIFDQEVTRPALTSPAGVGRLHALCDAFLSYVERQVFPGGCFFAAAAMELAPPQGRVGLRLREVDAQFSEGLQAAIREAVELGELDRKTDVAQLAFELDALMLGADFGFVVHGDVAALQRARVAVRARLLGAATQTATGRSGSR